MPYTALEKKIEALPKKYVDMVADYVSLLELKIKSEKEDKFLQMESTVSKATMNAMWEELKNDTW